MENPERYWSTSKRGSNFWYSKEYKDRCARFSEKMRQKGTFGRESEQAIPGDAKCTLKVHRTWLEVRGNGMAPRYFDGEVILANLDATMPISGLFGVVGWKGSAHPLLCRIFLDHDRVSLTSLSDAEPVIVEESDILFYCEIIGSQAPTWGTACQLSLDRKEFPRSKRDSYRYVETLVDSGDSKRRGNDRRR